MWETRVGKMGSQGREYGKPSWANCTVLEETDCTGDRNFLREFTCSYCYLGENPSCSTNLATSCRSSSPDTSRSHWYVANCRANKNTLCLGSPRFSKRLECNWTEGYRWKTALVLSITLGGFGADRFYLGHWQEGIGKLFSFGGLGVWTLVDVVLVAVGYIGPADGSLYI
ncbi:TM2 domain-containing protein almondex isoform X2 [Eurytemora carolleeae]|uniref:TM2 domain-containing protein almondex isoform X2 n=1 Tax=Eurytemora carolleeae TaxID=1294199 RepID=UPI000C78DBB0|nr:TM2 domain-containing protein almondex isoform X2 [Eurytemora carolleeae]|eukprot:XP_023331940.1 TM2 domain-containing protein almondex-like isoform X2 [Eurytemora affinis]